LKHRYCLVIVLVTGIAGVAWPQAPGVVRATSFVLLDDQGRDRAKLEMGLGGPWLWLMDENGRGRILLTVDKDGSKLTLLDENGKIRIGLAVDKYSPGLILLDENGKTIWSAP